LLLPGRAGEAREALRSHTARLPRGDAGVAGVDSAGAALGRQCPDVHRRAALGIRMEVVPRRPADLPAVVLGGGSTAVLGARSVLRLAVPVRGPSGAVESRGEGAQGAPVEDTVARSRTTLADQVHRLPGTVR